MGLTTRGKPDAKLSIRSYWVSEPRTRDTKATVRLPVSMADELPADKLTPRAVLSPKCAIAQDLLDFTVRVTVFGLRSD
jgi:hypothetical protein